MFHWRFHFDNETPVKYSFTQWKWTQILDFGPWGQSALNMGFVGKRPSGMQEQWVFFRNRADSSFRSGLETFERSVAPARFWHSEKFVGGTLTSPSWFSEIVRMFYLLSRWIVFCSLSGHIGPPIMLTIGSWMASKVLSTKSNLYWTHVFLVSDFK